MVAPTSPCEPKLLNEADALAQHDPGAGFTPQLAQAIHKAVQAINHKLRALQSADLAHPQALLVQETVSGCDRLLRLLQNSLERLHPKANREGTSRFDVQHAASVAIEACADLLEGCSISLRMETQPRLQALADRDLLHRLLCAMIEDALLQRPRAMDLCISTQARGLAFTLCTSPQPRAARRAIAPSDICTRLAQAMGGQITGQISHETGVTAYLPLAIAPAEESVITEAGLRILVADDNAGTRAILEAIFQSLGHHVEMVGNGQAAVSAARLQLYDLIVLDVAMPGLDGLAACAAIRSQIGTNQNTPIIALSALSPQSLQDKAAEAGFDGVLPKPIEIGRLVALIRLLARPGSIDAAEIEDVQDHEHGDETTDQPKRHSAFPIAK